MAVNRKSKIAAYCRKVEYAERKALELARYLDAKGFGDSAVVEASVEQIVEAFRAAYRRDCRGGRYRDAE